MCKFSILLRTCAFGMLVSVTAPVIAVEWTLEASLQRALDVAPELQAGSFRLDASRAAVRQAGVWPNPVVELRADDRLGMELGDGGRDVTSVGITQPLPLGRIGPRRRVAEAAVNADLAGADETRLEIEYRTAVTFHRLQLAQAKLALAREAAQQADEFLRIGVRRAQAGDISRREALRLELYAAQMAQAVEEAEGEWSEARHRYAALLDLEPDVVEMLAPLKAIPDPMTLAAWIDGLDDHPQLRRGRAETGVALAERGVARSERLPQFAVTLYREYEAIAGDREPVTGAGLSLQLPLWDRQSGRIDQLTAQIGATEARLQGERRLRMSEVRASHLHLSHLISQAHQYEAAVLDPAREILILTRRGWAGGEVDLRSLIDAADSSRDMTARYQDLLAEAWLELAELRVAGGRILVLKEREGTEQ